jgi:two-component system, OmpR family, alkaline phosphatase synthesis response regulator PhoP
MSREHALVVDDEEDIRELLQYSFLKHGYRVTCVSTGEKAIEVARTKLPDVIILDVMLPGLDGIEVAKLLKNDPKTAQIPIIMLTARTGEADIVTGLELGADD